MRILILSPTFPIPPNNGTKRRIFAFATHLARDHDVTLVCLNDLEVQKSSVENQIPCRTYSIPGRRSKLYALLRTFASRYPYEVIKFYNNELQEILKQLFSRYRFDVIWVNCFAMASYLLKIKTSNWKQNLLLLDQHNLDESVWHSFVKSRINPFWKLFALRQLIKVKRLQARWLPLFRVILSVSKDDIKLMQPYINSRTQIWLAPNGADTHYFKPVLSLRKHCPNPRIVFGGSMDVTMNQDGVLWFIKEVYPLVHKKIPSIQFWIVGRNPPLKIQRLNKIPGVHVTGTICDVRDYYAHADVFIVPVRLGGGTKLKTLEAMAMALPIVSTSTGAQGLQVLSGKHLYIANDAETFANRIIELIRDREKAIEMGKEARYVVEKHYGWDAIVKNTEEKLVELIREKSI